MSLDSVQNDTARPSSLPLESTDTARYGELDLFGFFLLLLRNLKLIVGCGVVAFLVMLVAMLLAKPRYAATATMIIPQGNVTTASLQAKIAANTLDLLGGGFELYSDILKSRTIGETLVQDFNLVSVYGLKDPQQAVAVLAGRTKVETSREGLIRVTTEDTDPKRAADLSNDYLTQLDRLNSKLVLSAAAQQRAFLERELTNEKESLITAEVALKQVQETSSGLPPDALAATGLSALATTRAQLRAAQIRLSSLLTGETEQNPEVVRVRSEISGLSAQLEQLQRGADTDANGTPTSKLPGQTLEYTRRYREVKFHETLFELLEKQYNEAKSQEAKTPQIVQVLDKAIPSKGKSWPPRTIYCLAAGFGGMFVGLFIVLIRALIRSYIRAPRNAQKVRDLKNYFGGASARS